MQGRGSGCLISKRIVITAAFTIFGGVIVYVVGQLLSKFLIEPVQDLRKTIGETRFNLAFYASEIHTPISRTPERSEEARDALTKSSCDLLAKLQVIPFHDRLASISRRNFPPRKSIEDAAVQLRGLSTYVHETGSKAADGLDTIAKRVERIETLLGLKPLQ
jgi:hypothetical protein